MQAASSVLASTPRRESATFALEAAARVVRETGMTTFVVLPRSATMVAVARDLAHHLRLRVSIGLMADGIEVQYRVPASTDPVQTVLGAQRD